MSQHDLIGRVVDGLRRGCARPIDGICRYARRELREEAHLARHIGCEHRCDDLAEDHLVHFAAVDFTSEEQLPGRVPGECYGGDVGEYGAALGEWSSDTGNNGDSPAAAGIDHVAP